VTPGPGPEDSTLRTGTGPRRCASIRAIGWLTDRRGSAVGPDDSRPKAAADPDGEGADVAAAASLELQLVAGLCVLVLGLFLAPALVRGELPAWQVAGSLAALALGLAAIVLVRLGRPRAGVLALVAALWAHVALPMAVLGLRYSLLGTRFAMLPLVLAALMLGRREIWATFAVFAAAATAGAARDAGRLGGSGPLPTLMPATPLLSTLVLYLVLALVLDRLAGSLRRALAESLRGNRALREQERMREELRQAQKLEAIGRLAGGVAHDFNNILTSILSTASAAAEELPGGHPLRADLEQIAADGRRAGVLTHQLLAFARKEVVAPRLVELDEVVRSLGQLLHRVLGDRIRLDTRPGAAGAMVLLDRGQLEQVLINLAVNARDAMPDGGRLVVSTGLAETGAGVGRVVLSVADEGPGIPPEVLPHIFEPFFTTKAPGHGTGLGLSTCHGIVAQAGGEIAVESTPGKGARFEVRLPRASGQPEVRSPPAPEVRGGAETVLLVEDQSPVRGAAARVLRGGGYVVLEAEGVAAALRVAAAHQGTVDLLVADVGLPDGSGREVADALGVARSATRVLFTSGHPEDEVVRRGVAEASVRYLRKPFAADDLLRSVREALDGPRRIGPSRPGGPG
jgi:signal transduction histidine kinase/ActR/RegA family two-component response regulator